MHITHSTLGLAFVVLAMTGCGTVGGRSGDKVQLVDRDGVDMIAAPAGHVSVLIKSNTSDERICGGRMPDAIMDSSVGVSLPMRGVGVGSNSSDLALGGRSPQVLIVRELLYRLCEISLNAGLSAKDVVELYKDTLPMISQALLSTNAGTTSLAMVGQSPSLAPPPAAGTQTTGANVLPISTFSSTDANNLPGSVSSGGGAVQAPAASATPSTGSSAPSAAGATGGATPAVPGAGPGATAAPTDSSSSTSTQ